MHSEGASKDAIGEACPAAASAGSNGANGAFAKLSVTRAGLRRLTGESGEFVDLMQASSSSSAAPADGVVTLGEFTCHLGLTQNVHASE